MKKSIAAIVLFSVMVSALYAMNFTDTVNDESLEVASLVDLLNGFHQKTIEDDGEKVAIEEIYSAINAIYLYEDRRREKSLRMTSVRKHELLRLFQKLEVVLEAQLPALRMVGQEGLAGDGVSLMESAIKMVNNHVKSLKNNETRAINLQPAAQVLVSLLNILMETTNVLANHAVIMPLTNEAQIAQHNAVQWWGIRIGAAGLGVYLVLQGCNASSYCNVPLPSVENLLHALPKLIPA